MDVALLHLDAALASQGRLRQAVSAHGGRELECRDLAPSLRLWCRPAAIASLRERLRADLPKALGPMLVFGGSGDFHHVTLPLVERALEVSGAMDATLLHFDNHPDWVRFGPGVHCGSWVGQAARLPGIRRILTVGPCSADLRGSALKGAELKLVRDGRVEIYPYTTNRRPDRLRLCGRDWPAIQELGAAAFGELLRSRIDTSAIYVTIDKDVLSPTEAATNWDQGRTSLAELQDLLTVATAGRQVIGADVFGDWSPAVFGGGLLARLFKRCEAMIDQPWQAPAPAQVAANEQVNLDLLAQFQALAA